MRLAQEVTFSRFIRPPRQEWALFRPQSSRLGGLTENYFFLILNFYPYNIFITLIETRQHTSWILIWFSAGIIALCSKSNGSYVIKDFRTLPLIFFTSIYSRWKFQPCPSFFSHTNIPDKLKRGQLSLEKEKVKVKS